FAQLLYAARAITAGGAPALSAWRADLDPAGRVVWLELVWLFSDAVAALEPVEPTAGATDLPLAVAARPPGVLVRVRAPGGGRGRAAGRARGILGARVPRRGGCARRGGVRGGRCRRRAAPGRMDLRAGARADRVRRTPAAADWPAAHAGGAAERLRRHAALS